MSVLTNIFKSTNKNILVIEVFILLRIREVYDSDLGLEIGYPE
jgi:hypothetical protein